MRIWVRELVLERRPGNTSSTTESSFSSCDLWRVLRPSLLSAPGEGLPSWERRRKPRVVAMPWIVRREGLLLTGPQYNSRIRCWLLPQWALSGRPGRSQRETWDWGQCQPRDWRTSTSHEPPTSPGWGRWTGTLQSGNQNVAWTISPVTSE